MIPPIGMTVEVEDGIDWITQIRLGDEQFILYWGRRKRRWAVGDKYEILVLSSS